MCQSLTAALARVRSSSSRSSATRAGTAGRSAGYRLALWKPAEGQVQGDTRRGACAAEHQDNHCNRARWRRDNLFTPSHPSMPTCIANGEARKLAGRTVGVAAQLYESCHHAMLRQVAIKAVAAQQGMAWALQVGWCRASWHTKPGKEAVHSLHFVCRFKMDLYCCLHRQFWHSDAHSLAANNTRYTPVPTQVAQQVAAACPYAGIWMPQQRGHQRYELALCRSATD